MRFPLAGLFGKEEVIGVDLGDSYVGAAQLGTATDGTPKLLAAGWVDCALDAPESERVAALKRLWKRFGLRSRTVCSCLRSPALLLRHFEFGPLSDDELASALRLEAEEAMQAFGNDLVLDWCPGRLGVPAAEATAPGRSGLLFAAPRHEVDHHLRVLHRAGLYPVAMDVGCLAVCNLFLGLRAWRHEDEAVGLVGLLTHSADIAIIHRGECIYPRTVLCTSSAWENAAGFLGENIQDALCYYRMKGHHHAVERIVLVGNVPAAPAFINTLSTALELPVERWNPLLDLRERVGGGTMMVDEEAAATRGSLLAACLGLALRST
jgi:Tfp pilus assembly PilM family ATPase